MSCDVSCDIASAACDMSCDIASTACDMLCNTLRDITNDMHMEWRQSQTTYPGSGNTGISLSTRSPT